MHKVLCPHCGKEVELTDAFKHQIESEIADSIKETLTKELTEKSSIELTELKKELDEKNKKVVELRDQEINLRAEKRKIEEREKDLTLEVERKLDEQRKIVAEEVSKKSYEEHKLKDLEKEKKIRDMENLIEELRRKSEQGSQQTQGEVLELDLEENLRQSFPSDSIEPVGKGVRGADVRQIVRSPMGNACGVILWESKRTKAWVDEWATKLKEDLRSEKADIPVIVTTTLPKEVSVGLALYEGVWVVKYELALVLAQILRKNILDVARQKAVSAQKSDKASMLYDYVMGHEFRQQVEAIAEIFKEEQELIQKERASFERIWKARESRNKRLIMSTANIYGSVQGLVGTSMPQIKGLDLMELEDGNN